MSIVSAFGQNHAGDVVANGLAYAFGTNRVPGAPMLNIRLVGGAPVVEVPKPDALAGPYVSTCVEVTHDLAAPAWTNRVHACDGSGRPVNCNWFQPDMAGSNSFFRLRATLLE